MTGLLNGLQFILKHIVWWKNAVLLFLQIQLFLIHYVATGQNSAVSEVWYKHIFHGKLRKRASNNKNKRVELYNN